MAKLFPILYGYRIKDVAEECRLIGQHTLLIAVPWDLVKEHEAQAQKNHGQDLERLAERGGLDLGEMLDVLEDKPYGTTKLANSQCNKRLKDLIYSWVISAPGREL